MESILFWNKPPTRESIRSVDPLGFDALREAMADALVPLLTGATRDADEYLWTLVGLRWARELTGSSVDATIFNRGFAPFERALKQYWYKFERRDSGGITVVKKLCEGPQPDLRQAILVDQRATGLLGNYVVSLRGMGLVQKDSIRVVDEAAERLLMGIKFSPPPRSWASSWGHLKNVFCEIDFKATRSRLGIQLFTKSSEAMRRAATATLKKPKAQSWGQVARWCGDKEQTRLAKATTPVVQFESAALEAFGEILGGQKRSPTLVRRNLRSLAAALRDADPFPTSWTNDNPLRSAISHALSSLARGKEPTSVLLGLHVAVTHDVRQIEPWILHLGDIPPGFQQWQPGRSVPDFRFKNLRKLLRQTRWRPSAF